MRIAFGFDVPPQQAINYFRAKGLKQTFSYDEMVRGEHAQAFTIAKMLDNDLLQDVYDSLLQAMVSGESMQDWKKRLIPHLQANGWWGKQEMVDPATGKTISAQLGSVRRLELIFRTNMQSAYAAGQWQQIQANKATMPYLQYNAVDDLRTRDEHRALNNKVYPVDHPFWRYYYPPNGWNCRCSVIQLSQKMLDDAGLSVSPDEDVEYKNWKNPRTGETVKLPKGIDPGFQFNAGIQRAEHLQELAREKARAIRDAELRDAAENGLALVERAVKGEKGIMPLVINPAAKDMNPVRTEWGDFPDVSIVETNEKAFRQHPNYDKAKAGSIDDALILIQEYLTSSKINEIKKMSGGKYPLITGVQAVEGASTNVIPEVFASYVSMVTGWQLDNAIFQQNRVGHTKSSGFHRMATPALFGGAVIRGENYLLLDDFIGQGGTLANMKGYIESNGGFVIGAVVMAGKDFSARLKLQQSTLTELRKKHGTLESEWLAVFGYGFELLTESEARYLIRTENADRIRAAILAEAKKRNS